ncbi:MAG: site-specific integrase [Acidimicrobiia bacterium]|nr:site-specific integrase [Acidimicrobiia bacterium]
MAYVRRRILANGSKRYECCWRDAITRQERSKSFARKVDAENFGKLVDADLLRGLAVPAPADGLKTVAQVVGRWFSVHAPTLKPKTAHSYENLITSRILPALGQVRLNRLRFSDVQSWVSVMAAEGLSASRIRQAHVVLASALDLAARDGVIAANPARGVTLPGIEKRERPWLEPAMIETLADACPEPYPLAVRLMGYEGLRWGELAALRRRSVDLLGGRLLVRENLVEIGGVLTFGTPKSGKPRTVPILDHMVEPLEAHLGSIPSSPTTLVFVGPRGAPLRYSWWRRRVWDKACEATGVDLPIHALRHSAGKALANSGVPAVVLKSFMGHASAAFSIDVYGHVSADDLDDAAALLSAYRDRSLAAPSRVTPLAARDARGIAAGSRVKARAR